jgi:hypothetical protein
MVWARSFTFIGRLIGSLVVWDWKLVIGYWELVRSLFFIFHCFCDFPSDVMLDQPKKTPAEINQRALIF